MESKNFSGIKLVEVRVRNFRSLKSVDVKLDYYTIIVGENNAGKSNFIEALSLAIGFDRKNFTSDDIFMGKNETSIDKNLEVLIDLLFKPTNDLGELIDSFPTKSKWVGIWGGSISFDEEQKEVVALRTRISWDNAEQRYKVERKFLKRWLSDPSQILDADYGKTISFEQIEKIALYSIDANRDISKDVKGSNNPWKRIISNLNLPEEKIKEFETLFIKLNSDLTSSSTILKKIEEGFNDLTLFLSSEENGVKIQGVPKTIEELEKKIEINFATKGSRSFPMEMHSSGTRSISSILLLKVFFEYQRSLGGGQVYHPLIGVEEPESHLHPQSVISFFEYLKSMNGQVVLTSHSPIIIKESDLFSLRRFVKIGDETKVVQLTKEQFNENDIHIMKRRITKYFGDILFSRAIVLFEGAETEDQAIPIFWKEYFQVNPANFGVSTVGVGGHDYKPFLKFARAFDISFYIFSDGERNVVDDVKKQLEELEFDPCSDNIFFIPDDQCFEQYIATKEYREVLIDVIVKHYACNEFHEQKKREEWKVKTNQSIIFSPLSFAISKSFPIFSNSLLIKVGILSVISSIFTIAFGTKLP